MKVVILALFLFVFCSYAGASVRDMRSRCGCVNEEEEKRTYAVCKFSNCIPSVLEKSGIKKKYNGVRSYNDITRPVGGFNSKYASMIILRGILVDKSCVPITDARISLVQVDEYGEIREMKNKKESKSMDRGVVTLGTAYTDNTGYFEFFTVEPKFKFFNIYINHREFKPVRAQVFLVDRLGRPNYNKAYLNAALSVDNDMDVYDFGITLDAVSRYKKF